MTECDMCYPVSWNGSWHPGGRGGFTYFPTYADHKCAECLTADGHARLDKGEKYVCVACTRNCLGIVGASPVVMPLDVLTMIGHFSRTWKDLVSFALVSRMWCTAVNRDLEGESSQTMDVKTSLLEEELWFWRNQSPQRATRCEVFVSRLRLHCIRIKWVDAVHVDRRKQLVLQFVRNAEFAAEQGFSPNAYAEVSGHPVVLEDSESTPYAVTVFDERNTRKLVYRFSPGTGDLVSCESKTWWAQRFSCLMLWKKK